MEVLIMAGTEETIGTAGTGGEEAIPGGDYENLADAGPAEMGRVETDQIGKEQTIPTN